MTDKEARRIIIQNTESLKANPLVTVDNCLYEAFDRAIQALEQQPTDITWVVGNDGAQVAFKNMPVDKAQQICAIIGDEAQPIIPSDATNGDVLKAIFGAKFIRNTLYGVVCELDGEIEFSDKWWFAPYREDEADDESDN